MGFEVEETEQYQIEQEYLSDLITALIKLNLFVSTTGWVQNEDRRLKTQKRRPHQNRLKTFEKVRT